MSLTTYLNGGEIIVNLNQVALQEYVCKSAAYIPESILRCSNNQDESVTKQKVVLTFLWKQKRQQ